MVNLVNLKFDVTVEVHDECAEDLGKDLAKWLRESWFNGEDIIDVEFRDYEVVL